jgi:hypothetical protein
MEVPLYQCDLCGWKWTKQINYNGKVRGIPKRCASCKRYGWNGEESFALYKANRIMNRKREPILPKERGLRRKIKRLPILYCNEYEYYRYSCKEIIKEEPTLENSFDLMLVAKFLILENPRPTVQELKSVLYPEGALRHLTSKNQTTLSGYVPDPDKPGFLKYDKEAYVKWLRSNAAKQQLIMKDIIRKYEEVSEMIYFSVVHEDRIH